MDISTIAGIIAGFVLIISAMVAGGDITIFINVPSMFITLGGTISATFITYPLNDVLGVMNVVKNAFLHKEEKPDSLIRMVVSLAETARREGILSLEQRAEEIDNPFLQYVIRLAVDGTEPELIKDIMETEIDYIKDRHKFGAGILEAMGAYAPAFGMIGTLIGLVLMLNNLDDPSNIGGGMATALITTFYGSLFANLVFIPLAGKLKNRSKGEVMLKEIAVSGVLSIQSGDNPRIVESKLMSFIAPKLRISGEEG